MDNQVSLFPDILGTEIEETVKKECERTSQYNYENYFEKINNKHEGLWICGGGFRKNGARR